MRCERQRLHGMGEALLRRRRRALGRHAAAGLRAGRRARGPAALPGAPPAGERRQHLLRPRPAGRATCRPRWWPAIRSRRCEAQPGPAPAASPSRATSCCPSAAAPRASTSASPPSAARLAEARRRSWTRGPRPAPADADAPPTSTPPSPRPSAAQPAWDAAGGAARGQDAARDGRRAGGADARGWSPCSPARPARPWPTASPRCARRPTSAATTRAIAERDFAGPRPLPGPVGETNALELHGRGVFVCISPWNFPLSIFTGQIAAALAAGNAVLAKPAEQTPRIAAEAVRLFHAAGPRPAAAGADARATARRVGQALIAHPGCDGVAFTGGTDTACAINRTLAARDGPIVPFIAETGGLNAMFVDTTALREQVIDDVDRSRPSARPASAARRCGCCSCPTRPPTS